MADTFYNGLMSFYLRDEQGQSVSVPIYVQTDSTQTAQDMLAEGRSMAILINNLTGCAIERGLFGLYLPTGSPLRPDPAIGSLAIKGATFKFRTVDASKEYAIVIPSILDSKLTGVHVNTGDTDVAAFITRLVAPDRPYVYTDSGGLYLDTFVSSFLNVRKPSPRFRRTVSPA